MIKLKNLLGFEKTFFIFLLTFFILFTPEVFAETHVSENIDTDTTWVLANSPYIVDNYIEISSGIKLIIEPGVIVKFAPFSEIDMREGGSFQALGTSTDKIYFTSISDDETGGDTNADGSASVPGVSSTIWHGINISNGFSRAVVHVSLQNVVIRYADSGFSFCVVSDINIKDSIFEKNDRGINDCGQSNVTISNSKIINNKVGIYLGQEDNMSNSIYSVNGLSIYGNSEYGVDNETHLSSPMTNNWKNTLLWLAILFRPERAFAEDYNYTLDFRNTWWGDASGPMHSSNSDGRGDKVSDNVLFDPWLTSDPFEVCTVDCFSNVLFFPGLMGSKLYEKGLDCGGDLTGSECGDKGLWLSVNDSLQEKLSLNSEGKSIKDDIFTKNDTQKLDGDDGETGIIDEMFGLNTYKSFITDLKDWKQNGTIKDYAFIPYDWRFSLEDIITNGAVDADNNLSYDTAQNFSESFILKKLEALQKSSKSGKVTIIAHSNGGLVTKALVQKLKDTGNPLYDKIDKIIFVAVPQVGTPDAFINLLHGADLGPGGFIMSNERSRQLAENMPTVYNLLPSSGYFTMAQIPFAPDKLITFENKHLFDPQISKYGLDISDDTELKDYILGGDDRAKPTFKDTLHPNIGNSVLYDQAQNVHQILDNWQPSPDTKVIQVAGWGEETFAGFSYKSYLDFWGNEKISYKPKIVVDGDGTVVEPSALWMSTTLPNVERWWVDLAEFNGNDLLRIQHKDILEVPNLLDFVKSKIMDVSFVDLEKIIVKNNSTLTSNKARLHFTLHSPLSLGITDEEGRYTGMDPVTKEVKQEIPDVDYRQIGEVQFLSVPVDVPYILKLQGYAEGSFSLDVEKQTGNTVTDTFLFEGIRSFAPTLATMDIGVSFDVLKSKLKVDENGDGSVDKVYPIVTEPPTTPPSPPPAGVALIPHNSGGRILPTFPQVVEQPKTETKNTFQVAEAIKPFDFAQNKGKVVATTDKIDKESQIEKQKETTETKNPEEIPLVATVIDSGQKNNWIWYVIILSVLIVGFFVKKYY